MSSSHGNGSTDGGGTATGAAAAAAASAAAKSSRLSSASEDLKTKTTTTTTTAEASSSWGVGGQRVKRGLPEMLKGGVIMDVTTPNEAKIAESAGACAVMALEKIPSDIRKEGGVARMSDPMMIESIQKAVSIPVMAKCRIGHFVEAEILQAVGVDCIDESEVLTTADEEFHIEKSAQQFTIPFVCGCRNLGEALRRINEGASMIRTKGEAGTGNIVEAVRHIRAVKSEIDRLALKNSSYSFGEFALQNRIPKELVVSTVRSGRLPVVTFAAGGIATPADAVMCMKLGMDGVFVGSGIFRSEDPQRRAEAIVKAVTFYNDSKKVMEVSRGLGGAMAGVSTAELRERWAKRESGSSSSSSAEDDKGSLMMKPLKITG